MINNLQYGQVQDDKGNNLLRVSYVDSDGVPVQILVEPNPISASKLLYVNCGDKLVDPLPDDSIAVLQVESQLRERAGTAAELEGVRFCSIWTLSQDFNVQEVSEGKPKLARTQNMSGKKYIFGRLWYEDRKKGQVIVYWTKHFEEGKDKPLAWLAAEGGKFVSLSDEHQNAVDRLMRLIESHDTETKADLVRRK